MLQRETAEAYTLALVGGIQGFYRYYVKPELTAKRGWLAVGAVVAAHELACDSGQTLSEGVDKALEKYPIPVKLAIGVTALHLLNLLPESIDPIHQASEWLKHGV